MPALTKEDIATIHATHDEVIRIKTLLGNGDKGLCHDVQCTQKRVNRLELIVVGVFSSGALGGGVFGFIKWLNG